MKPTITKAQIFESQGLKEDAFLIYKEILKYDPENKEAKIAFDRLESEIENRVNSVMLDFFLNLKYDAEIREFKRWLIKL